MCVCVCVCVCVFILCSFLFVCCGRFVVFLVIVFLVVDEKNCMSVLSRLINGLSRIDPSQEITHTHTRTYACIRMCA